MLRSVELGSDPLFYYIGPDISEGVTPTAIYFSLSAEESLLTDPFNQVALHLANRGVRVFSIDLPAHGANYQATKALSLWAEEIAQGNDILTPFFDKTAENIKKMVDQKLIDPNITALVGLSRGVMFAAEVAARIDSMKTLLGFAPLTKLKIAKEFLSMAHNDIVSKLDLETKIPDLLNKKIRFYVSNRDTRISTKDCFDLIHHLAIASQENGIRSPELDLIIKPPIGMHGHGTSKQTFIEGAEWLLNMWGI